MPWYWPTTSTAPTWVMTSASTTMGTWWSNSLTSSTATTSASTYISQGLLQQMYAQQQQAQQTAYERYEMGLYRPTGLGSLFNPSRPALMTHQDEAQRDEALYRRALVEHNDQEAARLLRIVEAHARTAEERRRFIEQQTQAQYEETQRRAVARDRARELLLGHLTPAQRETFNANGWFIVQGGKSKTRYRIKTGGGAAGNIEVLTKADRVSHRLCCHAQSHIPLGDQWLSQKIMLELAEDDFLRIANRHAA